MTGPTYAATADPISLPGTPLADAVIGLIRSVETPSVFHHSIRSYLFARLLAGRRGLAADRDYDDDLLFAGCAMHDLGVASDGPHRQRFEVEGADRAASFLIEHAVSEADADQVWQAIALHTSPGIAERRGTLCALVREGVAIDFGGPGNADHLDAVTDEQAEVVHAAYPRLDMVRSLTDAIVAQAAKDPRNAPRHTVPGELLRERESFGRTRLEHSCRESRWGS
ncbi:MULTISPECIES: HD domain-containing protein [unclassified Streptomyces]|uniref:HD domain-containing protein n=1 Tax=unclassified Streptomyces TaxID=2593676 RepID=UPI000DB91840|nr:MULTISPECIES: HD domain-containing protein [Streptomyces]MYU07355.1 HD domain-containing protein [Streptomyces sp. SID8366]MYU65857.1 HD domain-containing protein [Streptomyces sp. SID69]RAJ61609.1 HD domain-containing protein [Streptomyces sp. PsTaAH-130]TXJ78734.1 HD domain-containing protein [Streptomyces lavendulae]